MKLEILGITKEQEEAFFAFVKAFGLSIVGYEPDPPAAPAPYEPLGELGFANDSNGIRIYDNSSWIAVPHYNKFSGITQEERINNLRRLHHERNVGMRAVEWVKRYRCHHAPVNQDDIKSADAILADLDEGPKP